MFLKHINKYFLHFSDLFPNKVNIDTCKHINKSSLRVLVTFMNIRGGVGLETKKFKIYNSSLTRITRIIWIQAQFSPYVTIMSKKD